MKVFVKPIGIEKENYIPVKIGTKQSSGIDLAIQKKHTVTAGMLCEKIGLNAAIILTNNDMTQTVPYMLLPRSSTPFKVTLRQSNMVGIIDRDYRDELGWLVDNVHPTQHCVLKPGMPLVQLVPLYSDEEIQCVEYVDEFPYPFSESSRKGGFGSTDK